MLKCLCLPGSCLKLCTTQYYQDPSVFAIPADFNNERNDLLVNTFFVSGFKTPTMHVEIFWPGELFVSPSMQQG